MLSQPSNPSTAIHTSVLERLSPGPEHLELMSSRWRITDEQREEIRPTGKLTLTPEQKELSFADSFVTMAFDYELQHYGAARFALASGFSQVALTLLHHAVEMFLQVPGASGHAGADPQVLSDVL
jgi:hypothetical protein